MSVLLVIVAGGLGAVLRWAVTHTVPDIHGLPVSTALVNVVGAFLLGLVVGSEATTIIGLDREVVTIGLLGGLTTFSTWMVDIDHQPTDRRALLVATGPIVAGVIAAALGMALVG